MTQKAKKRIILLAPLVVYAVIAAFMIGSSMIANRPAANSTPEGSTPVSGDYEFLFSGTVEANTGRTFTLEMTGNKDEGQTLDLTVKEMPALSMTGRWAFVEGKGYKVFLDDASSTFAYARYNTDTQTYSVMFDYDLGNFGKPRAVLTYEDKEFAGQYDGIGLGRKPPVFALEGYDTYKHYGYGVVSCAEDGTVNATLTNTGAGHYLNRTGTWTYDESADEYIISFTDDTISLTDGELAIHEDAGGDYVVWTKFPIGAAEPEYGSSVTVSDLEDVYHRFTDPYEYHAAFDTATNSYQLTIEAQYNWGLGTGDIATFWGTAPLADMEG